MGRPKKHLTKDDVIALAREYGFASYEEKGGDDLSLADLMQELGLGKRQAREVARKLISDGKVREVRVKLGPHSYVKAYRPI